MARPEKDKAAKSEDITSKKEVILEVDNSVNPKAKTKYRAWCYFTTIMSIKGELKNTQIKKGDIITAKKVPQVWINQAVSQKFLIREEDYKKWNNKEKKLRGYN